MFQSLGRKFTRAAAYTLSGKVRNQVNLFNALRGVFNHLHHYNKKKGKWEGILDNEHNENIDNYYDDHELTPTQEKALEDYFGQEKIYSQFKVQDFLENTSGIDKINLYGTMCMDINNVKEDTAQVLSANKVEDLFRKLHDTIKYFAKNKHVTEKIGSLLNTHVKENGVGIIKYVFAKDKLDGGYDENKDLIIDPICKYSISLIRPLDLEINDEETYIKYYNMIHIKPINSINWEEMSKKFEDAKQLMNEKEKELKEKLEDFLKEEDEKKKDQLVQEYTTLSEEKAGEWQNEIKDSPIHILLRDLKNHPYSQCYDDNGDPAIEKIFLRNKAICNFLKGAGVTNSDDHPACATTGLFCNVEKDKIDKKSLSEITDETEIIPTKGGKRKSSKKRKTNKKKHKKRKTKRRNKK